MMELRLQLKASVELTDMTWQLFVGRYVSELSWRLDFYSITERCCRFFFGDGVARTDIIT